MAYKIFTIRPKQRFPHQYGRPLRQRVNGSLDGSPLTQAELLSGRHYIKTTPIESIIIYII